MLMEMVMLTATQSATAADVVDCSDPAVRVACGIAWEEITAAGQEDKKECVAHAFAAADQNLLAAQLQHLHVKRQHVCNQKPLLKEHAERLL
jgi:hypothetical protein